MPGWGQGQWGLSTWGLGSVEVLYLVAAYANSTRSVRVELSRPARAGNPTRLGDATNPASWTVTHPATGRTYTVLGAVMVGPQTVELYVLEAFPPYPQELRVTATALRDAGGALVDSPAFLPFLGVTPAVAAGVAAARDLANPQFDEADRLGGVLRVTTAGDYETHSGEALLKKLVLRRLMTTPGGFAHLPNYGLGLQVKEPLVLQDLQKLRAEIRRQLSYEPEIATADVQLTFNTAAAVLTVRVQAVLVAAGSAPVDATLEVPIVGL